MTLFKCSFVGTIGSPVSEQFVYSIWVYDGLSVATKADAFAVMDGSVASMLAQTIAASSPAATLGDLFGDGILWTGSSVREWDPVLNKQIGTPVTGVYAIPPQGTGADAFRLPNQSSLAVSTRTGTTGRRRWNRFYLPPMTTIATGGGDHVALSVCQALSDWLVSVQASLVGNSPAMSLAHYSPAGHTVGAPDATFIGTRLDTMRKRANQEIEVRVSDPL